MIGDKSTLERIIESATNLFLEHGYEGVGLREIARSADVTTGAFYRHFKGKKELFAAIVGDVYDEIIDIYKTTLSSFFLLPAEEQVSSMHDHTIEASDRMIRYMYEHKTETRLILCCSKGTDYSDLARELSGMDEKATDDFTMGYADVNGFRLGTCRPVKWINPITRQITSLTLHPLSIMDCTLDESKYMGLNEEEALKYCLNILYEIKQYNGEVVLLWHNSSFSEIDKPNYHKRLYLRLLKELTA